MAAFGGIWQRTDARAGNCTVADLLAALHAPFHTVLSAYDDERLVLGAKSLAQPAVVSHGGVVAALTGRLDEDLSVADVLDAYLDAGNGGLQHLSGDYAIVICDPRTASLMLLRDAVGTQPLYFHVNDRSCAFGSQIKVVLAAAGVRPQPNHAALAQLLIGGEGVPVGETCFSGIHAVPPGEAVVVTRDTINTTKHADLRPIVPTALKTFDQSAAAFRRALCGSVNRRLSRDANTAVLVSGGLDSAAIVCAAAQEKRDGIIAISYGAADGGAADERKYVDCVTSHARVKTVRFDLDPTGFPDQIDADVWTSETPLCDDVPATLGRAAAVAREHHAHHIMLGTWGDQVLFPFPPPYLLELLETRQLRRYRDTAREIGNWLADVPASDVRAALVSQAVRAFVPPALLTRLRPPRREFARTFDSLSSRFVQQRRRPPSHSAAIRRAVTAPAAVDGLEGTTKWGWAHGLEAQLPFVDATLVQLLLAIPAPHALNEGVPKALLRTGMAGLVPAEVLQRRDKGDYTEAIVAGCSTRHPECIARLEGGERLVKYGIMSRPAAQRALARTKRNGNVDVALLSSLMGVDAWLRAFIPE